MASVSETVTSPFRGFTLREWQQHYRSAPDSLRTTLSLVMGSLSQNDNAWIYLATAEQLEAQILHLEALHHQHEGLLSALPLYGVPFAVKDNMDIAGWPTTAACPAFAYTAEADATVIANLKAKGAIVIGKTNLDQFATGLVGTRSPYGAVPNTFNPDYVSGGSSSGSASVLARGLVAFSLGTDTAGSGRVPAGFNNVVGLKPTKGWLSNTGVVPACRLNDSVSIFALTVADAQTVAQAAGGFDAADAYSRRNPFTAPVAMSPHPRFAVPDSLEFFGDALAEFEFDQALERLNSSGITLVPVDFTPFRELAEQLYYGAWVAERTVAVGEIFEESPEAMDPIVHGIVANGLNYTASDAWRAEYLRAELSRKINLTLEGFDALVVPTSPTIRTQQELVQEPVLYNSQFGIYTNFTNLADLSALALPSSLRADGLPAGITLIAPAWHDDALASFGRQWQRSLNLPLGATGLTMKSEEFMTSAPVSAACVRVAVVGAHLTGMPLNFQLTSRNAVRVEQTTTAATYKLYALANTTPPKPGLVRAEGGSAIIVELWDIPLARFGEFVAEIPAPLGMGSLELADGRRVKGFICEPWALGEATDITAFGGWRSYIQSLNSPVKS
ncbi:allophanate hydrolase [Rahnella variigena]|uniref:allophanate hydrolase n=1 Tax=Rahnella variigena TaxID=574964 RepID=UPI00132FAE50|nr:allophanate hydrolase [Rahnella variigena]